MKKIYFLWFLCLHLSLVAQELQVVDEYQQPVELVEIRSKQKQATLFTDKNGQVEVSVLRGATDIQVFAFSYQTVKTSYDELARNDFQIALQLDVFAQDEFVVSATRWKQSKKDVPNRITTISSKEVELLNPQTSADLLGATGEVFIQKSQQGGGSPMIRGFSTNRLLYTVDGVRMNNAIFRGGNIQNVISLDPFVMENTEVFFGPGGVIYGSDAIGGVMSFSTLSPELAATDTALLVKGRAIARYSSANNEMTGHADITIANNKWSSLTSFSYFNYDNLRMGDNNGPDVYLRTFEVQRIDDVDEVVPTTNPLIQSPTGYDQYNVMQKVRYQPSEKWDLGYAFHYSETSAYGRYDRLTETNDQGIPRSAVWNYGPQIWMMNSLSAVHQVTTTMYDFLSIRFAHQYFQESRIDRRFNHHRLRTQLEEVTAFSLNIDAEKKWRRTTFFYGLEGVRNDVESNASAVNITSGEDMAVQNRYPNASWNTFSLYGNAQYEWTEKMLFQAGARLTGFFIQADFTQHQDFFPYLTARENINNEAITGNVGWVYNINRKTHLSINASTGFRAPNVDDVGKVFDFTADALTVPNPALNAEYAYNAEVNVGRVLSDWMKLEGSVYYTYLDNAIVRRDFEVDGSPTVNFEGDQFFVFALQNAAFAEVYGLNASIELRLMKNLKFSSQFNYQMGEEEMEDGSTTRSRHAAPWFGVTRLTYTAKKLDIQLYSMYSGGISADNLNFEEQLKPFIYPVNANGALYSPGWYTLNLKMRYTFDRNLTVTLGLENITDQRYRTYSSGITAAGRNVVAGLVYRF